MEERALLAGCTSFIRVELLPLLRVLDFGLEIGCSATVGADEDGVGAGGEERTDALVVPGVGARGNEETLARLEIVRGLLGGWWSEEVLTAMLLRHIEQSCDDELALPAVMFLNLLWVATLEDD